MTVPYRILLDLLLVNAYRYSRTDRMELIVFPFVDVGLGQSTLCITLHESLYAFFAVVSILL